MTTKQLLIFFLFFFSSAVLYGQIDKRGLYEIEKRVWHEGGLELRSGEQVEGYIDRYSEENNDVLQLQANNKISVYDARQVRLFWFFDDRINAMRSFYALPYFSKKNKVEIRFFEVLVEGPYMMALQKLELKYAHKRQESHGMAGGINIVLVPCEILLLITPTTFVTPYNKPTPLVGRHKNLRWPKKRMMLEMMADKKPEIEAYITVNQLDLRKRMDVLLVVQHYNEIKYHSE